MRRLPPAPSTIRPKVKQAIAQLIGHPIVLHLDQVFLKPGRHGAGTAWHQDNAYFKIDDPMKGAAMWIAVHDATIANGTLEVIPGLAREKLDHIRDPNSDHHIRCYPPEDKALPLELPAGGVAFFAYGIPHCTRANNTDHERAGVAFHFINASQYTPELIARSHPIGTILTGPESTKGQKEYGQDMSKEWDRQVKAALVEHP